MGGVPRRHGRPSPEVRREQLLDAAARVFLAKGLAQATVADIAEAAGVGKGTIYLYFTSKTELLSGLRARYVERLLAIAGRLLVAVPDARFRQRLDRFVGVLFAFPDANRDLHRLLFHEAGITEEDALAELRALFRSFVA